MRYLLGTDEAGYGPNLGPLVISATVWRLSEDPRDADLYALLDEAVCPHPPNGNGARDARLAIADSKLLYRPGNGLTLLERGTLASLRCLRRRPASWRRVWEAVGMSPAVACDGLPWSLDFERPLPMEADPRDIRSAGRGLASQMLARATTLCEIRSRVVFPEEFNGLIDRFGTKGAALTWLTVGLVAELIETLEPEAPVDVICDKHGGRNRYWAALQSAFPDPLVRVARESRTESVYCWGCPPNEREMRFCVGAERFLPVALASMVSKYLRELAMLAFNDFWTRRLPGLRPTAGYPRDSRRFRDQIEPLRRKLGIDERVLWRER